jgi:pectinesterase
MKHSRYLFENPFFRHEDTKAQRKNSYDISLRLCALAAILFFLAAAAVAKDSQIVVKVTNPAALPRQNSTISVPWSDIRCRVPLATSQAIAVFDQEKGRELLSQTVDADGDGIPEELLFQSDFDAKETKAFLIKQTSLPGKQKQSLVDGRFMEPRQDYAWENDRIAYRIYGPAVPDVDNGIDVWTKRVRSLIAQKWYKGDEAEGAAKISYHIDHGEGADFFSVGKTLGCGSCALWIRDTLRQPGNFSFYRTIANGPIRTIFELSYPNYNVAGTRYSEVKRISLDAGSNLNKIDVTYTSLHPGEPIEIAAGIVKRKGTSSYKNELNGWVSLWGQTNDDPVNGALGTGLIVPKEHFSFFKETKDQWLAGATARTGVTLAYYAGAGWTRTGDFASAEEWNTYLNIFAQLLAAPLTISIAAN